MGRVSRMPLFLLGAFTVAFYTPSLSGDFLKDDRPNVVENFALRAPEVWPRFFYEARTQSSHPALAAHIYRPLTTLSWAIQCLRGAPNPFWFHLIDVLLHAANVCGVFLLALRLLGAALPALAGTALFALHPAQAESVSYISGARPNALFLLFCLLSLRWYLPGSGASRLRAAGSWTAYATALLCKETAVFFPIALAAHDAAFASLRGGPRRWAPYAGLALGYAALRTTVLGGVAQRGVWGGGWAAHAQLAVHGVFQDLANAAFPARLRACYSFVEGPGFALESAAMAAVLFGATVAAIWGLRKGTAWGFGLAWALAALLPVSNLIPIAAFAADRFLYAPLVGFGLALGARLREAPARSGVAAAVLLAVLGLLNLEHQSRWQSGFEVDWASHAVAPDDPCTALTLAADYFNVGKDAEAERLVVSADVPSVLRPNALEALALIRLRQGRKAEAVPLLRRALELAPGRGRLLRLLKEAERRPSVQREDARPQRP